MWRRGEEEMKGDFPLWTLWVEVGLGAPRTAWDKLKAAPRLASRVVVFLLYGRSLL